MLGRLLDKRTKRKVGLDIGSHCVTAVEVTEAGAETVIHSAGSAPIAAGREKRDAVDQGAVVHALKSLWSSAGFHSRDVVMSLPSESVYLKWLHLEAPNEEELDSTARSAAARGAPFPASDAVVDYRVLSSQRAGSNMVYFVMLVAASAAALDRLLDTAGAAGLHPLAVDVGPVAVLRGVNGRHRGSDQLWSGQPLAHCQIGASSTLMTVTRGGVLEFARAVAVGGNDFTQCIMDETGLSRHEAEAAKLSPGSRITPDGAFVAEDIKVACEGAIGRLAREIHRSLKFFTSQFAEGSYLGMTGTASLSGGGALLRGIDASLERQGIEVSGLVNPFAGFSVAAEGKGITDAHESAPRYTMAMGLAVANCSEDAPARRRAA